MEIRKFGTLLLGDIPSLPGEIYNGDTIRIGDTVEEKKIPWVVFGDKYIAAHAVCFSVPYSALNDAGLIGGSPVKIDGKCYLCRAPQVGISEKGKSEWRQFYNSLSQEDKATLLDKSEPGFWGAETIEGVYRAARFFTAGKNDWVHRFITDDYNGIMGYRPVLEPLPPSPPIGRDMVGKTLRIYLPNCAVKATLTDFSDYDLFFDCGNEAFSKSLDTANWGMIGLNGGLTIDRDAVIYHSVEDAG